MTQLQKRIKDFIISPIFPSTLIPVWTVVVIVYNIINSQNPIPAIFVVIVLIIFIIWAIARWSLEHDLSLVKEYKSLMPFLDGLDNVMNNATIRHITLSQLKVNPGWKYYIDEKGQYLDKAFYEISGDLNKIINNPYKLFHKNMMPDIHRKFNNLAADNHKQYRKFIEMVNTENISKNSFPYDRIKKTHEDFFSALNLLRAKFPEIKDYLGDGIFNSLEEPKQ